MIAKRWIIGCWIVTMGGCLMACAPQAVREAEDVVVQADSLWHDGKQYGIDEGDSATLAQAYKTLEAIHLPFREGLGLGSPYAHACYHYGKLLRAKGNPAEAMQAFIAATHSGTKDYHIIGRIYSNMGSICHLAGEFQLSYDMYERSAKCFLADNDSLSYYFLLNDMAFELAEQRKTNEALVLLNSIECFDTILSSSVHLTKAEMYKNEELYDSAIYYANLTCKIPQHQLTKMLIKAQSYSYMGLKDSAVNYANELIRHTGELFYMNSALYILTHEDNKKCIEEVRNISAERSDTQKLIEIRRGKLSQAVQLLDQDLHHEPDFRWLYAILLTLVVGGACLYVYNYRKRRQHALLSQQVEDLTIQNKEAETQHEKIIGDIEKHKRTITDEVEKNCQLIINAESFPQNIYWKDFNKMRAVIDCQFYMIATKLSKKNVLNETEIRLCILVLLNLSRVDISKTLPYASSSVGKLKDQTAKKLNTTGKNLRDYLIKMTVD